MRRKTTTAISILSALNLEREHEREREREADIIGTVVAGMCLCELAL